MPIAAAYTAAGVEGTFSPWGYSNPVYDAAVRTALSALAPGERATRSKCCQVVKRAREPRREAR